MPTTENVKTEKQEKLVPVAPTVKRHVMGTLAFTHLLNQDPGRHYVVVNRGDARARAEYESRGYVLERYRDGGVRPMAVAPENIKLGEPIESLEGFIFSIDRETLNAQNDAGFEIMAKVARQMVRPGKSELDELKRPLHKYFSVSNYTREEGSGMDHGEIV